MRILLALLSLILMTGQVHAGEPKLKDHVVEVARSSVEETLNGLLDAEADQIYRARRYERSRQRVDGRAKLETKAGEVTLGVPKVRRFPFESAALWGTRVSPGTASRLNSNICRHIEAMRNRTIEEKHPMRLAW